MDIIAVTVIVTATVVVVVDEVVAWPISARGYTPTEADCDGSLTMYMFDGSIAGHYENSLDMKAAYTYQFTEQMMKIN